MRTWLLLLLGLVALSLGLSWWHPPQRTAGRQLADALATGKNAAALRGAIQLADYDPRNEAELTGDVAKLSFGDDDMPGSDFNPPGQRFVAEHRALNSADATVHFFWVRPAIDETGKTHDALRAVAEEKSNAAAQVLAALARMGVFDAAAQSELAAAQKDLAALSDESLFQRWLRADRAVLEQSEDRPAAIREALLLLARPEDGNIVLFSISTPDGASAHIYAVPLAPTATSHWLELSAFEHERLEWRGIMRIDAAAQPELVRRWMVGLTQEAQGWPPVARTIPNKTLTNLPEAQTIQR